MNAQRMRRHFYFQTRASSDGAGWSVVRHVPKTHAWQDHAGCLHISGEFNIYLKGRWRLA